MAQIGAGCSGRVYRAVWRGQAVAVKAICHEEVMARGGLCEEQVRAVAVEARAPRWRVAAPRVSGLLPHSYGCKDRFTEKPFCHMSSMGPNSSSCPKVQAIGPYLLYTYVRYMSTPGLL